MNGINWKIIPVRSNDPNLIDRSGQMTYACTDPVTKRIYISNEISGEFYKRVLTHELGHCVMVSYGLLDDIHQMVKPEYWVAAEEFICNFVADYGLEMFKISLH